MSYISCVCLLPGGGERTLAITMYMNDVILSPLSVFVGHEYLYHGGLELNRSHQIRYFVYFISNELQTKGAKACAY